MILTDRNYYSREANREYLSVSQYKAFMKCEAAAMAQLTGEWEQPKTKALLIGSYVDSYFEGTLGKFHDENPQIYKKDGSLKADFIQAAQIVDRVQRDPMFLDYMSGEKQRIFTGDLFGCKWKIKIDSYFPGEKIVDLKVMRSLERIMGKSFVEYWGYDLQMAVYSAIEGNDLDTFLAVVTKQIPADMEIIEIPRWRKTELLSEVERNVPRIVALKTGAAAPERCGVCDYCRATKKLTAPIDFDLVGFSSAELQAISGGVI